MKSECVYVLYMRVRFGEEGAGGLGGCTIAPSLFFHMVGLG